MKKHDMRVIQCRDCGQMVSVNARACPHCGSRRFGISLGKTAIVYAVSGAVGIGIFIGILALTGTLNEFIEAVKETFR